MTSGLRAAFTGQVTMSKGVCTKILPLCLCTYQSKILCCQIIHHYQLLIPQVQMPYSYLRRRTSRHGRRGLESARYATNVAVCLSSKPRVTALLSSFYQEYLPVIFPLLQADRVDHQPFQESLGAFTFCLIFLRHSHSTLNVIEGAIGRFRPGFAQATGRF